MEDVTTVNEKENKSLVVVDDEIKSGNNDIIQLIQKAPALTYDDSVNLQTLKSDCIKLEKKTEAYFKKLKQPAAATLQAIRDAEKVELKPLGDAKSIAATKLVKISDLLEKERLEREQAERELAEKAAAEAQKKAKEEALKAAENNNEEVFEEKNFEAEHITVEDHMPVSTPVQKVKGMKVTWYGEVTTLRLLIKEILENRVTIDAIQINPKWLRDIAGANKDQIKVPGIVIRSKKVI